MSTRMSPWVRGGNSNPNLSELSSLGLSARLALPYQRELNSILKEKDPIFARESLLQLGQRLEAENQFEAASQVYAMLVTDPSPSRERVPDCRQAERAGEGPLAQSFFVPEGRVRASFHEIRRRTQQRLNAIIGTGSSANRAEFLLRRLAHETMEPSTLVGLTTASAAFRMTRLASISRLLSSTTTNFATRGFGARAVAGLLGFGVEATVFPLASRGVAAALGRDLDWSFNQVGREIAGSFIVLGAMKLTGSVVGRVLTRHADAVIGGSRPALQQAGMFAGILLGHHLETTVGLRPHVDGATTFVDSFAMLIQFNAAGRLAHGIMGEGFRAWELGLDHHARTLAASPSLFHGRGRPVQPKAGQWNVRPERGMIMATGGGHMGPPLQVVGEKVSQKPRFLMMENNNGEDGAGRTVTFGGYREGVRPYRDRADAIEQIAKITKEIQDPNTEYRLRRRGLEVLPGYFSALQESQEVKELLSLMQRVIQNPQIPEPPITKSSSEDLPSEIAVFYLQNRELRQLAMENFLTLLARTYMKDAAQKVKLVSWVREAVESPSLPTYFKPLFDKQGRKQAYADAVFALRRDLIGFYVALLPNLEAGEEEGKKGALLLAKDYLFDPFTKVDLEDATLVPEIWDHVVNLGKAYALLRRKVPLHLYEMKQAEISMKKVVNRIHFEADGNEQALEVLGVLAFTHLPSRKLLGELTQAGNEKAKDLLEKVEQKAQAVREAFGDKIQLHQWDTRKESTTLKDDFLFGEIIGEAWNWWKKRRGKKEDPK